MSTRADSGLALFEQGTARALFNNQEWADAFYAIAGNILARRGAYTTDEVTDIIGPPPGSPNAVGAAAIAFARKHGLSVVGYEKTTHASRRTARIAVWGRADR